MSIPMLRSNLWHILATCNHGNHVMIGHLARLDQAKCSSGRHYVGTADMLHLVRTPRQGEFTLRGVPLTRIATCYGTCTPTYREPHHHHPKALEFPSIETANKSLAGPSSPPSDLQVPLAPSHDKQRKLASHHRRVAAAPASEQVFFAGLPCPSRPAPDQLPSITPSGPHFQMP